MPSAVEAELGNGPLDFVLGDRHGRSCDGEVTDAAEKMLSRRWSVRLNDPYAGAFVTRRYGAPEQGVHVLQVEVNRALYMDEELLTATDGFARIAQSFSELIAVVATVALEKLPGREDIFERNLDRLRPDIVLTNR